MWQTHSSIGLKSFVVSTPVPLLFILLLEFCVFAACLNVGVGEAKKGAVNLPDEV